MYTALTSFSGKISMAEGEVRDIPDPSLVKDLLKAGYITETAEEKKSVRKKRKEEANA